MKIKINKQQIFRLIVQLAFLLLLPALFILVFGELKQSYTLLIKGDSDFVSALPALIEALLIIPLTILAGRFFCGWLCAFGTFNDLIYLVSSKVLKLNVKVDKKADAVLKYLKYVVLIFIISIIWTMDSTVFDSFSPWNAFAQLSALPQSIGQYPAGFILLAAIVVGAALIERFFCRYLCPLGAIFSIISRLRLLKLKRPSDKCGKCTICTQACPMGIQLADMEVVDSGECISCFKCTDGCPRKNIQPSILTKSIRPELISAVILAIFVGVYCLSGALGANIASPAAGAKALYSSSENGTASQSKQYKDGTYTGTGCGYRPELVVSVTIKNDKITRVEIISSNETPQFADYPFETIPQEIIEAQSTNVDMVSGATFTSQGILQAVEDALSKARIAK